ncbi:MAG TPA: HEAT repeat domain-containing protein [Tepidisphaeraceae bacterium]|nr:HEAT repeat domain-containing protein [Tepidisphaeraceae bacterium]
MLRWTWIEWLIAAAAAAASIFAVPSVCGDEIAASPVATALADGNVLSVGTQSASNVGKLLIDLETGEASARRACAEELSRSNDERSIGALIAAMKDEDADVRRAAMLGLWRVGRPAFDRLLIALGDDDYLVRRGTCEALGLMEDQRAISPILDCLTDSNPDVRSSAAWALGRLRKPRATRALIIALRDDFPQVRREAAWSLGEIKPKQAVEPLVIALRDSDNTVRNNAAAALAELHDMRAVLPLLDALRDEDVATRRQAARGLGCLGDTGACDGLIAALSDLDAIVRECAARALGRIEDARAVTTLVEVLGDEDNQVRRAASDALVQIGKSSVKALSAALESENPIIRTAAGEALNRWRELHVGDTLPLATAAEPDPQ